MGDCVGYIAGVEPITRTILAAAPSLKAISRNGAGVDNIDMAAAQEFGVEVLRAAGANALSVAELTIGHILAVARGIHRSDSLLKRHEWTREKGFELAGKTLGIIGCGSVGRHVARLALALGMKVLAHDPYPAEGFDPGPGFWFTSLGILLEHSGIVTLHLPPPKERYVIGSKEIAGMKSGVIVINTARAGLIDPEAMLRALDEGAVSALTLDAFDGEPPADWRLVDHPRVLATAHLGGDTVESVERATQAAIENLLRALELRRLLV
jgi:phosphoglycerate dehydrogenase-like enzyme